MERGPLLALMLLGTASGRYRSEYRPGTRPRSSTSQVVASAEHVVSTSKAYPSEWRPRTLPNSSAQRIAATTTLSANATSLAASFTWGDVNGTNYLTKVLNQHLPQYCGSCWAFATVSALQDRIKIVRGPAAGSEIHLSIQHILNCGTAGTCNGGNPLDVYAWAHTISQSGTGIAYESVNPYVACSPGNPGGHGETTEGFCATLQIATATTCEPINIARNCATFNQPCTALSRFPNATVAAYGYVMGEAQIMREVAEHGPVACSVDAEPLVEYVGGIVTSGRANPMTNHVVSIVGWGEEEGVGYWLARNSWGEVWGEMGFFRVARGTNLLNIESECAWAQPGTFTSHNFPCFEDGRNCEVHSGTPPPSNSTGPYGYGDEGHQHPGDAADSTGNAGNADNATDTSDAEAMAYFGEGPDLDAVKAAHARAQVALKELQHEANALQPH